MLRKPARAAMLALVITLAGAQVVAAGGATADPVFRVSGDGSGNPVATTFSALGFTPGVQVFIEQCDGKSPTAIGWDVTTDCDPGNAAPPVIASASGAVQFLAGGAHSFTPFKGEGPSETFSCLAPNDPALAQTTGVPDWRNCKVRISTSNSSATGDQVFLNISLPDSPSAVNANYAPGSQVNAVDKTAGSCSGGQWLAKVATAVAGAGLTDQTQSVAISASLLKDLSAPPAVLSGSCSGLVNSSFADKTIPPGPPTTLGVLTPKSAAFKLSGGLSCASTPAAVAVDGGLSNAYLLQGALNITFTSGQKMAVALNFKRDSALADVWHVTGQVTKGLSAGAAVSGSVYMVPVAKFGGTPVSVTSQAGYAPIPIPAGYNGYGLTAGGTSAWAGCSDGVAGNTSTPAVSNPVATRTDSAGTATTSGSATVTDPAITAGDVGRPVSGSGIPSGSYVGTVTAGALFKLSSSPTQQIDVAATASGPGVALKITTDPARNIAAVNGIPYLQLGDGISPLGHPTTGLSFSF